MQVLCLRNWFGIVEPIIYITRTLSSWTNLSLLPLFDSIAQSCWRMQMFLEWFAWKIVAETIVYLKSMLAPLEADEASGKSWPASYCYSWQRWRVCCFLSNSHNVMICQPIQEVLCCRDFSTMSYMDKKGPCSGGSVHLYFLSFSCRWWLYKVFAGFQDLD